MRNPAVDLTALVSIALIGAGASLPVQAAPPDSAWQPSSQAPERLLTELEAQRHDFFIRLARDASSCTAAPLRQNCTPGGIDVVFFGMTYTEMWWWPDRGMPVWEETVGSHKAANFGSQGTRPESLLWRMRHGELDGYEAKLVVLQTLGPGLNLSRSELASAYRPIIAEIRARQPQAKILIFDPPRGGPSVAAENAAAHAAIVDNETVFYTGLSERFLADRVGYEAWAETLKPWLERFAG